MPRIARLSAWLTLGYLGVIGIVTIGPALWRTRPNLGDYDVLSPATWLDPATWENGASSEFTANILLFVPLGFLLRLALPRATWLGAVALGTVVSFAIEIAQMWTPRISDPRDIVANTAGALIGAVVAATVSGVARWGGRMRARRRARGAAAGAQSTARPPSRSESSSTG